MIIVDGKHEVGDSGNNQDAGLISMWLGSTPKDVTVSSVQITNSSLAFSNWMQMGALYLESSHSLTVSADEKGDGCVTINNFSGSSTYGNIAGISIYGGGIYAPSAPPGEEPEEPAQSRVTPIFAQNFNVSNISDTSIRANGNTSGIQTINGGHIGAEEKISVSDVTGSQNAFGINMERGGGDSHVASLEATDTSVDTVQGTLDATGIRSAGAKWQITNNVDIKNIEAINGTATGFLIENTNDGASLTSIQGTLAINNVKGKDKVFGISAQNGQFDSKHLKIRDVGTSGQTRFLVNATDSAILNIESVDISPNLENSPASYQSNFNQDASEAYFDVSTIALRSTSNAKINLISDNQDTHRLIVGDIVAGRGSNESEVLGGKISISGGVNEIYGDVYAGNGGQITLSLGAGSVLEGQIDDYHELNSEKVGKVFKNSVFKDDDGNELEVTSAGKVDLKLDGATWYARGQSFVNTINLSNGGTIDLSKNSNSSVSIANLSGSGNFTMELGAYSESGEIQSDMLYIQNVSEGSHFTINAKFNDTIKSIEDLVDLRFATVGSGASANLFSISIIDEGFYNHSVSIGQEDYQIGDADNERFNGTGDGKGEYKPGEDAIDAIYGKENTEGVSLASEGETSRNYFIKDVFGAESEGNSSLSDAGNALLATARGTYWTSVEIDRLTNRMGDARYANNGEDGLWIRLRQSRLGTDTGEGDFKSDNTVYQVGYDHAFQRNGGRQLVGIAFDYMDTDLDYKGISGEGNTDRYGITAYTTWLADNGFYVDVVGKWGRLDNDFDIINGSGGRVKADYDNNMWAISAEVGRKLSNPKTRMFIEPNAQLQYTMVTDAQYSTNQGTRVDQDRIDSVIGRMGVRIGRAFGEEQNHNIYAKADMFREFMGEQKIHVKDVTTRVKGDTITVQNKGFWFDVGGGFQSQLGRDAYAYADVEYRFGNDLDKSWIVNAGMRYEF